MRPFSARTALTLLLLLPLAACASGGASDGGMNDETPAGEAATGGLTMADETITEELQPYQMLYTSEQADDGEDVYRRVCLECHTRTEFGDRPFLFAWDGSTVDQLYGYIAENMPDDAPGSLDDEDYAAVMAYILEMNGYPAGLYEYGERVNAAESVLFRDMGS